MVGFYVSDDKSWMVGVGTDIREFFLGPPNGLLSMSASSLLQREGVSIPKLTRKC